MEVIRCDSFDRGTALEHPVRGHQRAIDIPGVSILRMLQNSLNELVLQRIEVPFGDAVTKVAQAKRKHVPSGNFVCDPPP